jgi:predicted double-glycine peptidase
MAMTACSETTPPHADDSGATLQDAALQGVALQDEKIKDSEGQDAPKENPVKQETHNTLEGVAQKAEPSQTAEASQAPQDDTQKTAEENKPTEETIEKTPATPTPTTVTIDNGVKNQSLTIGLVSWRDMPFQTVRHQAFDYSCGSAAVATLMTYTYDMPTTEKEVFEAMFKNGDPDKIRREGFSMLDMSRYLNSQGLKAKGFKITEKAIEDKHMPIIALVNNKGYNHFVVVKTVKDGHILVGDPNTGTTQYSRAEFAKIWNGIALVVVNKASVARASFDNGKEWRFARGHAPVGDSNDTWNDLASLQPDNWQLIPGNSNLLPITQIGTVASSSFAGTP